MPEIETKEPEVLIMEAAVRREVQKQLEPLRSSLFELASMTANSGGLKAEDWDFKVNRIEEFAGPGWIFVQAFFGDHAVVYAIWRMSRTVQASLGVEPNIATTAKKK